MIQLLVAHYCAAPSHHGLRSYQLLNKRFSCDLFVMQKQKGRRLITLRPFCLTSYLPRLITKIRKYRCTDRQPIAGAMCGNSLGDKKNHGK
jgi:hypothetical protein